MEVRGGFLGKESAKGLFFLSRGRVGCWGVDNLFFSRKGRRRESMMGINQAKETSQLLPCNSFFLEEGKFLAGVCFTGQDP